MKSIKIGNIKLKNKLFLAPMVDVTDLAYRLICRKAGAGMAYTEMLYVDAITHENEKTQKLMKTSKEDKPVGIQVTGNNVSEFEKAIKMKVFEKYNLVDINCGCPSIRITGNQAGSFLLKNPDKISGMIKTLKNSGYTTTAKIRLGLENNNVMKVAKSIEKAGADALTIHARLATQGTGTKEDWKWIQEAKKEIGIPVIGNGDIFSGKDTERMLEIADGAMIARAAIGDPHIFERISFYLKTGKERERNFKKNIDYFKKYLYLAKKHDIIDIPRIKYLGTNFLRNKEGAAKLRNELMQKKDFNEIQDFIRNI